MDLNIRVSQLLFYPYWKLIKPRERETESEREKFGLVFLYFGFWLRDRDWKREKVVEGYLCWAVQTAMSFFTFYCYVLTVGFVRVRVSGGVWL